MLRRLASLLLAAAFALWPLCAAAQYQPGAPLPRTLMGFGAAVLGDRVYVTGGVSSLGGYGGYLNNSFFSGLIGPDGAVNSWGASAAIPDTYGSALHAMVSAGGRLYMLGGYNISGPRYQVYIGDPNPVTGAVSWRRGNNLPDRLCALAAAAHGGRIYVSGGIPRAGATVPAVYSAEVNPDGSIGLWRAERPLPLPLFGHAMFAHGGRLFAAGGSSAPGLYADGGLPPQGLSRQVYAAAVNPDGTLADWAAQPPLPAPLAFAGAALTEKSAYLFGGYDGGVSGVAYFAPLLASGTGSWQALQPLPQPLMAPAAAAGGEYLYVLGGGRGYMNGQVNTVYVSKVRREIKALVKMNPDTINAKAKGKWVTVAVALPEADPALLLPASARVAAVNGREVPAIAPDLKWTPKLETGASEDFPELAGHSYMLFKFPREAIAAVIPDGRFSLKVRGQLSDGREFSGESMNRGLFSAKPAPAQQAPGRRSTPEGAAVDLPEGAMAGNPDLRLSVEQEELDSPLPAEEKEKRGAAARKAGLLAAGPSFEFGPHGEAFGRPVRISLPYDPALLPEGADEALVRVARWNPKEGAWEPLPSAVSREDRLVSAETPHFSVYQAVLAPAGAGSGVLAARAAPAAVPSLGEAYVYPNPARAGAVPALRLPAGAGDKAEVKVYTASGRLVYEAAVQGAPPGGAYELRLAGDFPSGVYYYRAEVSLGADKARKSGKFAVLR